ncbi:glycosyltransferase family 25 protein [Phyllobacterium sp. K27]
MIEAPGEPDTLIKAFIIHLSRSVDRQQQVDLLSQTLPVPADVVDAVDARNLTEEDVRRVYKPGLHAPRYPFDLNIREVACFLSHRKAWQAIVDQNLTAGLVLEDDVALTSDFAGAYSAAAAFVRPDDFIRFPFRPHREQGPEVFTANNARILQAKPVGLGMVMQLVGHEAAKRLLAVTETFDRPVDTTLQMNWITGLSPVAVVPGGVMEVSSQLGGSTIQQQKPLLEKLRREILRPIYRMRVKAYSRRQGS